MKKNRIIIYRRDTIVKKKIKIIAFMLISALLLTACAEKSAAPKAEDIVLKVGYGGTLCEAPLHMAVEKGFFEEEGLKVDLIKLAP
jgi:NitT/TauT family transport system substrate-binding protein